MMMIILSAFDGRLRSQPMEWSREEPEIRMPFTPNLSIGYWMGKDIPEVSSTFRTAVFQHTGKYEVLPNKMSAAIYELVSV